MLEAMTIYIIVKIWHVDVFDFMLYLVTKTVETSCKIKKRSTTIMVINNTFLNKYKSIM